MSDLIEELKDRKKAQPFGLLSDKKQEMLKKATKVNCLILCHSGSWETRIGEFYLGNTYILKPDYQPEPEWKNRVFASTCDKSKDDANNIVGVTAHCKCGNVFCDDIVHGKEHPQSTFQLQTEYVDFEIRQQCGFYGVNQTDETVYLLPFNFTHLHCLPSLLGFKGFWCSDKGAHISLHKEDIVTLIEVEKEEVFARFRKRES